MSAARTVGDEAPATVPQTTPAAIGYGHPEYQFVQSIMEMQKSLGEINASIVALSKSVESTKSKVDDLVNWKHKILGGAVVAGALISAFIFLAIQASHYLTIKSPVEEAQQPQQVQQAQSEPAPAPTQTSHATPKTKPK